MKKWSEMSKDEIEKNIIKCVDIYNKNSNNKYKLKVFTSYDNEFDKRLLKFVETPKDLGEYKTFSTVDEVTKSFGEHNS